MRVIIAGPSAVGKNTVAENISSKFDLKMVVASDIFKEMAQDQGFSAEGEEWWDEEEARDFIKDREEDHSLDQRLDRKLKSILDQGDVVLTSWTMPWLYDKEAVKILLKASQSTRARRMAKRDNISKEKALRVVKDRDEENRGLYKNIYGFDISQDHDLFDLVLNTDNLAKNSVLKLVNSFLNSREREDQRRN